MHSRSLTITAVAAGVILVPILLTNYMPYFRTMRPPLKPLPLPNGVSRLTTPEGLELLVAKPEENQLSSAPLLLVHGGYGTAHCYSKWLPYLASRGRIAYSLSLTGHGQSPRPGNFINMTVTDFVRDVEHTIDLIHSYHPELPRPVLVGHSSGGGVSQCFLSNVPTGAEPPVSGVVLVDAIPPTGSTGVYMNWVRADPLFGFRVIGQGGDPKGPLSSPALVQRIFFGSKMRKEELEEFFSGMNTEESVAWPQSMMSTFVDIPKAKKSANGRVAWISGEEDVIMPPALMKKAAALYDAPLTVVPYGGHHLMRDEVWKEGADALLAQLDSWSL